ncbi:hypothetical protein EDC01DRAFT_776019 [Geopyxis carbonaria]|nr:hypothetical protein EDC01DRAFT_776019 [Geopyxis carbonaria]
MTTFMTSSPPGPTSFLSGFEHYYSSRSHCIAKPHTDKLKELKNDARLTFVPVVEKIPVDSNKEIKPTASKARARRGLVRSDVQSEMLKNAEKAFNKALERQSEEKEISLSIDIGKNEQLVRDDKATPTTHKRRTRRGLVRSDFPSEAMKKAEEEFDWAVSRAEFQDRPKVRDRGLEDAVRRFSERGAVF